MTQMLENKSIKKQIYFGCLVCAIGAIFYCYEFVLRIIPGALQSELSAAFGHISATTFGQLSAFYYFAYSPMQLPVGLLMDRFGPRRLLTFACLCCTVGSFMFTYSSSIAIAGSGRFLVGFGSSFAFVGVLSLAMHWLPRRYFSLVAGLITTLGMLGLVYGEVKITEMAVSMGLQHVLFMMVVFGGVLTVLIFLMVRDGPGGFQSKTQPLPEFFRNVMHVLTSPEVWIIGFVGACLYTSLSVFGELWGKTYLEQAHHLTKVEAAHTISAMFLGWAVGAPIAGYFSDRSGRRVLPLVLGAFMSLICISLVLYWPGLSYVALNILLFLYGVFSATEIIVFVMAKENSGAKLSGTVFAATNMIVTLGGVIFQPLVGKLLDKFGDSGVVGGEHIYTVVDYQVALSILPLSLLMVMIAAFFLKDHKFSQN
ncbi:MULTISPECIES: MFS transporter [Legionella]|uniref:Lysosomal dipeptide transporter MFSD1 n=1 Tax=Legionella septentrionalis TaxID=2498109 RepID=A0A433JJ02_9GAMM|nr:MULTISPECIES: MFS transporter [Legionella]MCP0913739.1 MFS transporter [Legionella sp. 27cVA30]RUQ85433.1 MFS transporter [Legionella septentrionalis]RUQ99380.1 MFS transporter [Legionella septentrionalis]RUR09646.1 MFS transporter [Legionella septentrionalis]RUR14820.1 MFS transporter [Legionella septentrionalis]